MPKLTKFHIHLMFLSRISLFRISFTHHKHNIPIETLYSTLPKKSFAQVMSKLFGYEISDEKRPLNRAFKANVESQEPPTSFF